jgi:glycosyltransferase involved in cell wall biosynthesis
VRIGVVTTSYPRWPDDPAGNFVGDHVVALRALGHEVEVIAASAAEGAVERQGSFLPEKAFAPHASETAHRIPSSLFYRGGAPDQLEASYLRGALAGVAFTARMAAAIARRARRWDLIIAHWLAPSALAALPAGIPLVAIAHGGDIHTLRRLHLLGPTLRLLCRTQIIFVSEPLRAVAAAHAPWLADAPVQPMGIAVDRFARIPRAPTTPPTLLVASRLVPVKGVDVAIAAMAHLTRSAHLVVAGDGPERSQLRAHDRVTFLGEVDTRRRDALLATAAAVVVPSRVLGNARTEGTPLIALEALAAGVPVVASAVGGLAQLPVALVPPDDPHALAGAIDRTLAAAPSPVALRQSVAHLDWAIVARHILDLANPVAA